MMRPDARFIESQDNNLRCCLLFVLLEIVYSVSTDYLSRSCLRCVACDVVYCCSGGQLDGVKVSCKSNVNLKPKVKF